jgi:DNA-binding MarR family transcriptional regulator
VAEPVRVGPQQERTLRWARQPTTGVFTIQDVSKMLDASYSAAEGAVRKLDAKGFIELVEDPKLGTPNRYVITEPGKVWIDNFGGM